MACRVLTATPPDPDFRGGGPTGSDASPDGTTATVAMMIETPHFANALSPTFD